MLQNGAQVANRGILDQSFSAYASYKGNQLHGSLGMSRQTMHTTETQPKNTINDSPINQGDLVYQQSQTGTKNRQNGRKPAVKKQKPLIRPGNFFNSAAQPRFQNDLQMGNIP